MADFNYDSILSQDEIEEMIGEHPDEEELPTFEEEEDDSYLDTEDDNPESVGMYDESEDQDQDDEDYDDDTDEEEEDDKDDKDTIEEGEDTDSDEADSSPVNIYPYLAQALQEGGVFPDLDNFDEIDSPEAFNEMIEEQVQNRLNETQKRIATALKAGVPAEQIQSMEYTIGQLSQITEEDLTNEAEGAEEFRKSLIMQDLMIKGFTEERAKKVAERSVENGNDIEDAREALESVLETYKKAYTLEVANNQAKQKQLIQEQEQQAQQLEDYIMNSDEVFPDIEVNKKVRRKVLDFLSKPTKKNAQTGQYYTDFMWELESDPTFSAKVGLLYTLTNGFKDLSFLVNDKVNKAKKRAYRELEEKLNSSRRYTDGTLKYANNEDSESIFTNYKF